MNAQQKIAAQKIRKMTVTRYPDVTADKLEESEGYKLREVDYHSSGAIISDTEFNEDGTIAGQFLNILDEKGQIVEHQELMDGEVIERSAIRYNEHGKIVEETRLFDDGDTSPTFYTYDGHNELLELRVESSPGEIEHGDRYEYHPEFTDKVILHEAYLTDKKVIKIVRHEYERIDDKPFLKQSFSENKESGVSYRTEHFDATVHEDNISAVIYDSDNRVSDIIREWYDEQGRMIRTDQKSRNPASDPHIEYAFDEHGNLCKQVQYLGGNLYSSWEKKFNENGLEEWVYGQNNTGFEYTDVFTYEFYE